MLGHIFYIRKLHETSQFASVGSVMTHRNNIPKCTKKLLCSEINTAQFVKNGKIAKKFFFRAVIRFGSQLQLSLLNQKNWAKTVKIMRRCEI